MEEKWKYEGAWLAPNGRAKTNRRRRGEARTAYRSSSVVTAARAGSNRASSKGKCQQPNHQENDEQNFGYACRSSRDSSEAQQRRYQRDY